MASMYQPCCPVPYGASTASARATRTGHNVADSCGHTSHADKTRMGATRSTVELMYRQLLDAVEVAEISTMETDGAPSATAGPRTNSSSSASPPTRTHKRMEEAFYNKFDYMPPSPQREDRPPLRKQQKSATPAWLVHRNVEEPRRDARPRPRTSPQSKNQLCPKAQAPCEDHSTPESSYVVHHTCNSRHQMGESSRLSMPCGDDLMDLMEYAGPSTARRPHTRHHHDCRCTPCEPTMCCNCAHHCRQEHYAHKKATKVSTRERGNPATREAEKRDVSHISSSQSSSDTLRDKCRSSCECYWKELPLLDTPINPASHAATCPCQSFQEEYEAVRREVAEGRDAHACGRVECKQEGGLRSKETRAAEERIVLAPPLSAQQTSAAVPSARGAIFGTAKRRTLFDDKCASSLSLSDASDGDECHAKACQKTEKKSPCKGEDAPAADGEEGHPCEVSGTRACSPSKKQRHGSSRAKRRHHTPGPGAYEVAVAHRHSSQSPRARQAPMSTAPRIPVEKSRGPGPGAYDVAPDPLLTPAVEVPTAAFLTSSLRSLQMGLRPATAAAANTPGPGAYHPEKASPHQHTRQPAYSFPKSAPAATLTSTDGGNPAVGPAAYHVQTGLEVGTGRAVTIGLAQRPAAASDRDTAAVPGPGSYAVEEADRQVRPTAPAASIRFRHDEQQAELESKYPLLGPGHYDSTAADALNSRYRSVPEWSIRGGPPRFVSGAPTDTSDPHAITPGPGEYLPIFTTRKSAGFYMGTAPRGVDVPLADGLPEPGPGAYDLARRDIGIGNPITSTATKQSVIAEASERARALPGPGEYGIQYDLVERRSAQAVLGAARFEYGAEDHSSSPGPGAYDIDKALTLSNQTGAIIGTAPRLGVFADAATGELVGPGAYMLPALPTGASFTMRGRPLHDAENDAPGPGSYEVLGGTSAASPQPPRVVLATTSSRFQLSAEDKDRASVPGPGNYEPYPTTNAALGPSFGTALRYPPALGDDDPIGPGSYNVGGFEAATKGAVLGTSPRFEYSRAGTEVPGPGAYEVALPPTSAFVFGAAPRLGLPVPADNDVPGPASYDPHTRQSYGPNIVFGTAPARPQENKENSNIGPGLYSPIHPDEVPPYPHSTFSMAPREVAADQRHSDGDTAGPGAYDLPPTASTRAAVFGAAPRGSPVAAAGNPPGLDVPGPGAYDAAVTRDGRAMWQDATGVVFGTADRGVGGEANAANPGPGSYEAALPANTRAAVFGTSQREGDDMAAAAMPGPGAYELSLADTGNRAVTFGTSQRVQKVADGGVPGPGAYDVRDGLRFPQSPQYSLGMGGRSVMLEEAGAPGPGHYETSQAVSSSVWQSPYQAIRFGTDSRFHDNVGSGAQHNSEGGGIPGPGHYSPQYGSTEAWNHAAKIGTASRMAAESGGDDVPGPGKYDVNSVVGGGPQLKFTTAPRFADDGTSSVTGAIGPASYDAGAALQYTLPSMPVHGFGSGVRQPDTATEADTPGPGYYHQAELPAASPPFTFTTAPTGRGATEVAGSSWTPGPGHYDVVPATAGGPSITISSNAPGHHGMQGLFDEGLPGPGAYDLPAPSAAAAPKFPQAERFPRVEGDDMVPGPGHYNTVPGAQQQSSPGGSVGLRFTAVRFQDNDIHGADLPGPGHYAGLLENMYVAGGGPTFTLAERFPATDMDPSSIVVGPGTYNAYDVSKGPSHVFGSAPRFENAAEDHDAAPGPGTYTLAETHSAPAFSMQPRRPLDGYTTATDTPGPGAYDCRQELTGRATSMHGRVEVRNPIEEVPGPGAYDVSRGTIGTETQRAPALRGRVEVYTGREDNPGPGAYDTSERFGGGAPAYSLYSRNDQVPAGNDVPGPGSYDTTSRTAFHDGPAFSMQFRPADAALLSAAEQPGPGSYAVSALATGPAVTFGTGQRPAAGGPGSTPDAVGPGTYDVRVGPYGPAYSFGFSERADPAEAWARDVPGPGAYGGFLSMDSAGGVTIPQGPRDALPTTSATTPGPGAYQGSLLSADLSRTPTIGLSGRQDNMLSAAGPGPGHYYRATAMDPQGTPSFGIGERPPLSLENKFPGPGAYEPHHSHVSLAERGTYGPSFGVGARTYVTASNYPGPGAYHNSAESGALIGPSFPTGDRFHKSVNNTPGPGAYYKEENIFDGISFTRALRPDYVLNTNPGPGAYHATEAFSTSKDPVPKPSPNKERTRTRSSTDDANTLQKLKMLGYPAK